MSVLETRGYYTDNGDVWNNLTGNKVTMKHDANLLQVHWQNSENAGVDPPITCSIYDENLAFNDNGTVIAGTKLDEQPFWMDDIANLYADYSGVPTHNAHSYYILGNGGSTNDSNGNIYGNTFYPDDGSNPFPQVGTYLNWTGAVWQGAIWSLGAGWNYMFNVVEVTIDLVTLATGTPRRTTRIANSPRLTVQRVRR